MISIIIPVKQINDYIYESITHFLNMDYADYEVIVYPDYIENKNINNTDFSLELINTFDNDLREYRLCLDSRFRFIETGELTPGEKRDLALLHANGEYFAFIDDDAYPSKNWLISALNILKDETIGGVGGPAITAPSEDIFKVASGKVYESYVCCGGLKQRYVPGIKKDTDDIPSVNLIIKKDVFEKVGGYSSKFYPGEDTKLCLAIINSGKRLVYDPNTLVYHHRRPLFAKHLKQIKNYALHRGYFVRLYPQTSFKLIYFIPSLFVIGLITGPIICMTILNLWSLYFGVIILYLLLAIHSLRSCLHRKEDIIYKISLLVLSLLGIFTTHIVYGVYFVKGLAKGVTK